MQGKSGAKEKEKEKDGATNKKFISNRYHGDSSARAPAH